MKDSFIVFRVNFLEYDLPDVEIKEEDGHIIAP